MVVALIAIKAGNGLKGTSDVSFEWIFKAR